MLPHAYTTYFAAASGAAGALIGLLFVAVSLDPDSIFRNEADLSGRAVAGSAFASLVNIFILALLALIPDSNLGIGIIVAATLSLAASIRLQLLIHRRDAHVMLLVVSSLAYLAQIVEGIAIALHPHDSRLYGNLCYIVIASFSVALVRAWSLMQGKTLKRAPPQTAGPAPEL